LLTLGLFALLHLASPLPGTPSREPALAASRKLMAVAFGSGRTIYVATSKDGGRQFSPPVRVFEAGILPLSRHRGPRIAISGGAIVVTAVVGRIAAQGPHAHGMAADGDLLAWRSLDGGRTWTSGTRINDVPAAAHEGLHALAAGRRGHLFATWLDLRAQGTRLFGATSRDGGATWSKNFLVYESPDGTVCQCCRPSAAVSPAGALAVMWRNCLGGARDLYLVKAGDGRHFGAAQKLGEGTWRLNACPMDGGGLAFDGRHIVTAWRRDGSVFLDEPGQPEKKLGDGKDVVIAAAGGRVLVLWTSGGRLVSWGADEIHALSNDAAFPEIAPIAGGHFLAAWEENGGISVERLP
jgi:hypothetical protein